MATKPGVLTHWPWEDLGSFKYALYLPLVVDAVRSGLRSSSIQGNFSLHVLVVSLLRYFQGQLWMTVTRMHDIVAKHRVQEKSIKFEQLDREENWEEFILFQALLLYGFYNLPFIQEQPACNVTGLVIAILWHMGPVEFVYYWFHRLLHHHYLFRRYHSHHHSSFQTQAVTGNVHPFAEHFGYAAIFGSTLILNYFLGTNSIALIYVYSLVFDFLNFIGHCNWEFIPTSLFRAFPPLKYLLYTPSFHALHHTQVHTNFCLFMPLYDYLYGTVDKASDNLHLEARRGREEKVDFVYLTHPTGLLSIFHFSIGIPSFACRPYAKRWYIVLLYPVALPIVLALWLSGVASFAVDEHTIDKLNLNVWAVPRFNFQYKLATEKWKINKLIERSILKAQQKGARVISLGMHNKDLALNANGALFVKNNSENLRIRIVDGSTLITAIVVNKVPRNTREVFLVSGIDSKVGRAITLYFCSRREEIVSVKVLCPSETLFEDLKKQLSEEEQSKLCRVQSLDAGKNCKTWICGTLLTRSQQAHAPAGTCFYQFSDVETMEECRQDCSYAKIPAMQLPAGVKGLRACEGTLPRGVVQASHAAGILHALQGWNHNEVGVSVDLERLDTTLDAALSSGFVPYY